jgi:indolepyruvate ferredoxin oxidoreductase beta subunit
VSTGRLLSVLIPAVGGQGGGVLLDWIVEAALADGYPVQGTSIPGVAQRTGSTTYYVELYTERVEEDEAPNFSLYPVPGALDVLLAPELLEVGRMIELGFPSPDRTTIVASTHRLYSIHEKIVTGRGIYPGDRLLTAARTFARRLVAFDALALARAHGTEANAVLLGALAASEALPVSPGAFRRAIETKGVQVETNRRGFEAGYEAARRTAAPAPAASREPAPLAPELARLAAELPVEVGPMLRHALPRLVDYQDLAYARRYVERLQRIARLGDPTLLATLAGPLAVWMTYEDAVRVAQLKTRVDRFERIRREVRAGAGEIVVTDYLKPDLDEIWGILPRALVAPLARWAIRRWPERRPTLGQHVRTTTVAGYLRVWVLARLRRLRPISWRAHEEHARMERWLGAVERCAGWDRALARELARAPQIAKGYGEVRRRLTACLEDLLASVVGAAELEAAAGAGFDASRELAARYRALVLQGPEGEGRAAALARDVLARLRAADRSAALAALAAVAA